MIIHNHGHKFLSHAELEVRSQNLEVRLHPCSCLEPPLSIFLFLLSFIQDTYQSAAPIYLKVDSYQSSESSTHKQDRRVKLTAAANKGHSTSPDETRQDTIS